MRTTSLRGCSAVAGCVVATTLASCVDRSAHHSITEPEPGASLASVAPRSSGAIRVSALQVERISGRRTYAVVVGGMGDGERVYIDRTYTYQQVPAILQGHTYLQTANGDQASRGNANFLRFSIDRSAFVYVAFHGRTPPEWVRAEFAATGLSLQVVKGGGPMTFHLYGKPFAAGEVTLGSNRDGGGNAAMYTVILVPQVAGQPGFASVVAGFTHSCGLTTEGRAYCWGENATSGQLGDATEVDHATPVAVAGGLRFSELSAGAYHTCGMTVDNEGYCWGRNSHGQLGNSTHHGSSQPVRVSGGLHFASIGAGGTYSCGLTTQGHVYCWGSNEKRQLGSGSTGDRTRPGRIAGGRSFTALSVGHEHACGIATNGAAFCWGKNELGQLGDGTFANRSTPVAVVGRLTFSSISATGVGTGPSGSGQNHTCALTLEGRPYCWGDNWHNNLGINDSRGKRSRPQAVKGVPALRSIATGGDHTCGLTAGGHAWCWGDNLRGQLGNGPRSPYNPATRVAGGLAFSTLAVGWDHTCGVTIAGEPFCWGYNGTGQLGDGTRTNRDRPVAVVLP